MFLVQMSLGLSLQEYMQTCNVHYGASAVVCTIYYLLYIATSVILLLNLLTGERDRGVTPGCVSSDPGCVDACASCVFVEHVATSAAVKLYLLSPLASFPQPPAAVTHTHTTLCHPSLFGPLLPGP